MLNNQNLLILFGGANTSLLNNFEIVATAIIALLFFGETVTKRLWTAIAFVTAAVILLLGYVAYGLSIYCYTYAQRTIGAAKTSTYYALAPFIGALLSILIIGEPITLTFITASVMMAVGCWIAAK